MPQVTIGLIAPASTSISRSNVAPASVCSDAPLVGDLRRRARTADHPLERGLVGGDHPGAPAALDRHVADGHPALHRQRLDRRAGVLDHVTDGAGDADLADRGQDQVLGGDAEAELALVADPHRPRLGLDQALGGQHVLDLAGADPERQRAERAVRGGVRVAAHDRHARLGDAELGADHVHDPLVRGAERVQRDAELRAVALERLDLDAGELVADLGRHGCAVGGDVVVDRGQRAVGPADLAAGQPEAVEGLRAGHLVDQVQVDVDQAGRHLVGLPDLVEQALWHGGSAPSQAGAHHGQQDGLARLRGSRNDGAGRRRR